MTTFNKASFKKMEDYFHSGKTASYDFRKSQLDTLKNSIKKYEAQLLEALYKDLRKSPEESFITEIGFLYTEITNTLKHLKRWMRPESLSSPLVIFPSSSKIIHEPLGVTLIIAPWNYPIHLLLAPLIGAIAGGNCAVLKPSEFTLNTTAVLKQLIKEAFADEFIALVEGVGAEVVPQLLKENKFAHIFFTGSLPVGKEIAKLAAEKLTPVTLELGGKSPCIVDKDANIKVAAQRITWGKFVNAGQTCVAPDYLLVHESRKEELLGNMQESINSFYGKDAQQSPDYGRIINERRFDKLTSYLNQGEVLTGGNNDKKDLFIAPTIMQHVKLEQPIMQEEIFGPILPVFTFQKHEEALDLIQQKADPLAFYLFTDNKTTEKLYVNNVSFGGGCINNTLVHAHPGLPFGGVGTSGMGRYHGEYSFKTFTRPKAIVKTATWLDPSVKYPPYKGKLNLLRRFLR